MRILSWLVLALTAVAWTGTIDAAEYQAVPAQKIRPFAYPIHEGMLDELKTGVWV